jgi:tight adherence protein B
MILTLFGIFLALAVFIFSISVLITRIASRPDRNLVQRVKEFSEDVHIHQKDLIPQILRDNQLSKIPSLNKLLEKLNLSKTLHKLLEQSGSNMKVGQLILLMLIMAALGYLVGLKTANLIIKLALFLLFGSFPLIWIHMQCKKRLKAFIHAFPDAIDMMVSAIKAGHAFNQAMKLVGDEAPDPVGVEFKKTFEQYNLGINLKEALLNLSNRVNSLDLKLFVTAILLQRETGGNLTEILDKMSYTIRERFKLIGQIKTYTAQGRMSAWILGTLPLAFVLIISALNPGYLEPLFKDKLGHYVIAIAAFMQIVGFFFIQRIVRIKYQ